MGVYGSMYNQVQHSGMMLSARCLGLSIIVFCLGPVSPGLLHHSVLVGKEVEEIIVSAIVGAKTKEYKYHHHSHVAVFPGLASSPGSSQRPAEGPGNEVTQQK